VYVRCWVEGVRGVGVEWECPGGTGVAYLDICAGFEDGVFANHDGGRIGCMKEGERKMELEI
jgi:hypothetical protein